MAISTIPFHPLDAEKNRRYKVTKKEAPKIPWAYSDDLEPHFWEGYIRISDDGDYSFSISVDDNGFIEIGGERVVEVTGTNSSTTKTGSKYLKQGFHYVRLYHKNEEVPDEIAPYPNAEQFVPKMGDAELELWEIDAPRNIMKAEDAAALLAAYNVYGYASSKSTDDVYAAIGGWLNGKHTEGDPLYHHSCALRMSIGLSRFGVSLDGVPGANNILDQGDKTVLGGNAHVIISTDRMAAYITSKIGAPDYSSFDDYSTPQPGDIALFHTPGEGSVGHIGNMEYDAFEENYQKVCDSRIPSSLTIKEQIEELAKEHSPYELANEAGDDISQNLEHAYPDKEEALGDYSRSFSESHPSTQEDNDNDSSEDEDENGGDYYDQWEHLNKDADDPDDDTEDLDN